MRTQEQIEKNMDAGFKKEEHSVFGFFIRNFRITYLITLAIILLGGYALLTLPREAEPEVKIPFAVVVTLYPGASPTDVEELVTNKIEERIKNLPNLKRYNSSSGQGFSSVFVEFSAKANLKDSYQKLREEVRKAESFLPKEAETPIVSEISVSDIPITTYGLVGPGTGENLKQYAENLKNKLEAIEGVSKVDIIGAIEKEFQIIVDQAKLINYNVSLGQVVNAVRQANFNMPAGNIEIDGFKYNVRVEGKIKQIKDLNNIIVVNFSNVPIFLKDVAQVKETFKKRESIAKLGLPNRKAQNTISIQVRKKTGGNIISIAQQADKIVEDFEKSNILPKDITITKISDNSWFIKDTLNQLGMSGLQTMILIIALLLIVLGLRGALITGLSVPLAFLMAFIFLLVQGATLNSVVLFSLVISLGLMVDNAIIIMEGINEYITEYNKTPYQAAILSVWNFKWAIISGTLTTVAAFLPMLLVSGILGEFFAYIPKTISATLLSSLFVALIIIPTLAHRFIKVKNNNHGKINNGYKHSKQFTAKMKVKYRKIMTSILSSKKQRRIILASVWFAFAIAVAIPAAGLMKIEMFSAMDFDMFLVNVKLPAGSSLEATEQIVTKVEKIIQKIPELKNYAISLGASYSLNSFEGSSSGSHLSTTAVNLIPIKERKRTSTEIAAEIRPKLETIEGATISLEEASAGPPTGAPIEVRIFTKNSEDLSQTTLKITEILEKIPGAINVRSSIKNSAGEFVFKIKKFEAGYYGLDTMSIASILRGAVFGIKASSITIDGDDVDITVKYDQDMFKTASDLENILITTAKGAIISLGQVTDLSLAPSVLAINHRNGKQVATVSANVTENANLQKILKTFQEQKNDLNLASDIIIETGGEVEDIERSFRETFLSMIVALVLIVFILVFQFNSFIQPFIIILTLPLAIIGVIFGLNLLRMPFSFPAFLGIVSLAGIAVNDAIVLIDRTNKNIAAGMEKVEALAEAGSSRMQPIFLTSLTTIFGVFPLVFAAELWRGFSVTLIFGLIFSTALTLVIIPILYRAFIKTKTGRSEAPSSPQ